MFQAFENAYSFIKDIKKKEKEQLKKELRKTFDSDRKKEIKLAVQRLVSILCSTTSKWLGLSKCIYD